MSIPPDNKKLSLFFFADTLIKKRAAFMETEGSFRALSETFHRLFAPDKVNQLAYEAVLAHRAYMSASMYQLFVF